MSDPDAQSQPPMSHKEAKAQARQAKAAAKASRPWYTKKRFVLPAGLVAAIVAISVGTSGDDGSPDTAAVADTSSPTASDSSSPSASAKASPDGSSQKSSDGQSVKGLGDKVRDGKFEFTVKKVDCGKKQIGDQYLNEKAQGKFCLISMKVQNIGSESQSLFGDNQYVYDKSGRKFTADSGAAVYLDQSAQTLWEDINPGNAVNGVVVFDVPNNVTPQKIELHDSMFSGGVTVALK